MQQAMDSVRQCKSTPFWSQVVPLLCALNWLKFNTWTRRFRKRNWVAFMIVNISELEKGNFELYMLHGNLDIFLVQWYILGSVKYRYTQWNFCKIEDGKIWKNQGKAEGFVNVDVLNSRSYLSYWCTCCLGKMTVSVVHFWFHFCMEQQEVLISTLTTPLPISTPTTSPPSGKVCP